MVLVQFPKYFKQGNNLLRLMGVHQWNGLDETSIGFVGKKKTMPVDFLPKVAVD
jgi:hypothetical protein